MKTGIQFSVFFSLFIFASLIRAEERYFKIEMIVFSQDQYSDEVFNQFDTQIRWPSKLTSSNRFEQAATETRLFDKIYSRLMARKNYYPLLQKAWIQPVQENSTSIAVKIRDSQGMVDGFIRIKRGHLLHFIADIEYSSDELNQIYRINEKRRFKLNEFHYLDHPKFGVVFHVSIHQAASS